VVSVSAIASNVGNDVLLRGGNAVDAAVATAFALAVTFPEAGNIGGGGFMLVHFPDGREPVVIDYRETAPAAATAEMYVRKADRTQHRLAGVPGTVRGLALAHERYGKLAWRELVSPAVALAREGFAVDEDLAKSLGRALADAAAPAEFRRVFAAPDGKAWKAGDRLVQSELAKTLEGIAA
jgi:gamma-glutamyltranspeptidase/glutathione hydrolase